MNEQLPTTAYRILTPRLCLRGWNPEDARNLKVAVDQSRSHLKPWMPWAEGDPEDVYTLSNRIRRWRSDFDLAREFIYGIFDREEKRVLGACGLHTTGRTTGLEIGYWIHVDHIRQGLATEAAAALTRTAFEVNKVDWIEIHCDTHNTASAAVPRKLGYILDATLHGRNRDSQGNLRDTMVWVLHSDRYPASPVAEFDYEAYDEIGERISDD